MNVLTGPSHRALALLLLILFVGPWCLMSAAPGRTATLTGRVTADYNGTTLTITFPPTVAATAHPTTTKEQHRDRCCCGPCGARPARCRR